MLLFHWLSEDKLKTLHIDLDLSIELEDFVKLYEFTTSKPYNFLYIDVKSNLYRKNFNEELYVEHSWII